MSNRIEDLRPSAKAAALLLISRLTGIPHVVTSTLRTADEQLAYFAQGRGDLALVNLLRLKADMPPITDAENKYTVTKCDGLLNPSPHQSGMALDVVPLVDGKPTWDYVKYADKYREIGKIARDMGFECGMDWPPITAQTGLGFDPPHLTWRA